MRTKDWIAAMLISQNNIGYPKTETEMSYRDGFIIEMKQRSEMGPQYSRRTLFPKRYVPLTRHTREKDLA